MSGLYGLPYRPPAGGWSTPRKFYLGGKYSHYIAALDSIARVPNTTQLEQPDASFAAPTTRLGPFNACGTPSCTVSGNQYLNDANWLCSMWPELFSTAAGGSITVPTNVFAATSDKMIVTVAIANGGSGYVVGDIVGVQPPSGHSIPGQLEVMAVDGTGKVLKLKVVTAGEYLAGNLPPSPNAPTSGSGTGLSVTYGYTTSTVSYGACQQMGFNTVQARRLWQGRFPLGYDLNGLACDGVTQANVKYLSMTVTATVAAGFTIHHKQVRHGDGFVALDETTEYTGGAEESQTIMVNGQSGELQRTARTSTNTLEEIYTNNLNSSLDTTTPGVTERLPNWSTNLASVMKGFSMGCSGGSPTFSFGGDPGGETFLFINVTASELAALFPIYTETNGSPGDPYYNAGLIYTITDWEFTPTHFKIVITGNAGCETAYPSATPEVFSTIDTTFDYSGTMVYTLEVTLSGANYAQHQSDNSGVYDDAVGLAANWPLLLAKSPNFAGFATWRKDAYPTIAPLITRKEIGPQSPDFYPPETLDNYASPINDADGHSPFTTGWTPTWNQMGWIDLDCYKWVFPWGTDQTTHTGTLVKVYDGSVLGIPKPLGYGEPDLMNTQRGIFDYRHIVWGECPPSPAPVEVSFGSWTPANPAAVTLPANCPQWTNELDACKYWPCSFTMITANAVVLQKMGETKYQVDSINFNRPYGTDRNLKNWAAANHCDGDGNPVQADGSALPFRYPTCPPFGVSKVTGTYDGTNTTFTGIAGTWGTDTSWSVDIYNGTVNASGVLVPETTPAASAVFMSSAYVVAGNYSAANFVVPHGMTPKWDDTQSKGDFVTREYVVNLADNSVASHSKTQRALAFSQQQQIIGFSPNGENPPAGLILPFTCPGVGQVWLGWVQQFDPDPFFQQSKYCDDTNTLQTSVPCVSGCPDAGSCENIPPQVEARISVPAGAPALPSGTLDITADMDPPAVVGDNGTAYPNGTSNTPWQLAPCL